MAEKYNLGRVAGKSAYEYALDGGYAKSEEEFGQELASISGKAEKTVSTAITLLANAWEGEGPYTQTVAVEGLTGDRFENAVVFPEFSEEGLEAEREAWNLVDNTTTVEGAVYFLCLREKPIIDVPLIVKVRD